VHGDVEDLQLVARPERRELVALEPPGLEREQVRAHDVARRTVHLDLPALHPDGAPAQCLDRGDVVRHEHERATLAHQLGHPLDTPVVEAGVSDRDGFVDEQEVGLEVRRDREADPQLHPGGVLLHGLVDRGADTGELAALAQRQQHAWDIFLHLFPTSVVDAMARGDILQLVVFSTFFGIALAAMALQFDQVLYGQLVLIVAFIAILKWRGRRLTEQAKV